MRLRTPHSLNVMLLACSSPALADVLQVTYWPLSARLTLPACRSLGDHRCAAVSWSCSRRPVLRRRARASAVAVAVAVAVLVVVVAAAQCIRFLAFGFDPALNLLPIQH